MAHETTKHSNGKYSIWSTIVGNFIMADVTEEEVVQFYLGEEERNIRERVRRIKSEEERDGSS